MVAGPGTIEWIGMVGRLLRPTPNWKACGGWGVLGCWVLLWALPLGAQRGTGELRLLVRDATGSALEATVVLVSQANQVRQTLGTDPTGRATARGLPFGIYRLQVERAGFAGFSSLVEIRSEVPLEREVTLGMAPLETTVLVTDSDTLLDPHRTGAVYRLGEQTLRDRRASPPSRAVLDLVQTQPGWVLEANGVLHPRGSEYNTQYVIDGIPILDNRSPAFAPALEVEDLASMNVFTANYPAEYGRKLGGVIEVVTARDPRPGFHGKAEFNAGSFDTQSGYLAGQYGTGRTTATLSAQAAHTERYLDPPVEENFTNTASSAGLTARLERDWSARDRLRLYLHRKRTGFLVPNETLQQQAGQRQDRTNGETMGQLSYQRVLSPRLLANLRLMARDLTEELWSNPLSTPILAEQQRGFREGYLNGALSAHHSRHEFKAGGELIRTSLRERFAYRIADRRFFDDALPAQFRFAGQRRGLEQSLFVQDLVRAGRWTFSAGLRWDGYRLLVGDSAFSPRLGAAWHWPAAGLVLRASYDRAFQVPAIENLLLASSEAAQALVPFQLIALRQRGIRLSEPRLTSWPRSLRGIVGTALVEGTTRLPVPPSPGNFYQAGLSKNFFGRLRLDANYFRRNIRNFPDDSLLLNTGLSFPIAFSRAEIHGVEAKLEVPRWGPASGFVSYSNLAGIGRLPITGGLFLEEDSAALLRSTDSFPITQDQRNTAHARVRFELGPRAWLALGSSYASGLPIEREGDFDEGQLDARYSPRILRRVNLSRGRVRPSFSLDTSFGVELWKRERRSVRLQADGLNLTGRLNVINFAGLFSGTALGSPRSFAIRLRAEF